MLGEPEPEDCKIRVVDDNVDAADALVSLLGLLGFRACAVHGGQEAVLATGALHPKLIFLVIDMPGMDGYQAATCIRRSERDRDVQRVALTARGSPADRTPSASVGFNRHVAKPIGSKQLVQLAELACLRR